MTEIPSAVSGSPASPVSTAADIRADRRLLLPGPLPPLSHLGATMFRSSVHAAVRYALYQLGQSLPEAPPIRFVSLRPYFDAPKLAPDGDRGDAREIFGALIDPGGVAERPLSRSLRGSLLFHRVRLGLGIGARAAPRTGTTDPVHSRLSEHVPRLGDALLGELIAALARRRRRAEGRPVGPVQSRAASRFLRGRPAALERLGVPDPRVASWQAGAPFGELADSARAALTQPADRLRGGFREQYRSTLDQLRPLLTALGERASARGLLESVDDVFFLPLDLLADLDSEKKPEWIDGAIASNRAEWQALVGPHCPADTLGNVATTAKLDIPAELAPLVPLV